LSYQRKDVHIAVLDALNSVGGIAPRDKIKSIIASDDSNPISYEDVYNATTSRLGNEYIPFNFDFNFSIRELVVTGYIDQPQRGGDIVLTEKGRTRNYHHFPSPDEQKKISQYWEDHSKIKQAKKVASQSVVEDDDIVDVENNEDEWRSLLLKQLKQFSPKKFESFSRLLISKMGVKMDSKLGKVMSGDHGIDGFGYFESDDFRTSRVAIQAKCYTSGAVSEPEIDKFKGVMDGFSAEYGIFITTTYFTQPAKQKALKGNRSVTLIDGQRITELVEEYQLHIEPVKTFQLDDYYYEED